VVTEPIGVALIGAAHTTHAWSYARALSASPNAKVVGVYDPVPELARWIRADFDVPFYDDARLLLESPEVQAAIVCTPTASHRSAVELAASLGRHVLCEKPVATTVADAAAINAACDAAGVQLHVAFVSRFLPMVERAREAVRAGRLGELIGMVGGNRGRPPLPPTYPDWITDPREAGGGALIDHSVHVVDVMRHVSGLEVTTVSAEAGALLWDCGVDDVAVLSLAFGGAKGSGRAIASVDPSWSIPADNPWDYDFYLRLLGTEGSLDINDAAEYLNVVSVREKAPRGLRLMSFAEDADVAMIEAFVASIHAGERRDPCATGYDGLKALEVALAGYESSAAGAPVHLT
jgi:predicted dehydrogenase